MDGGCFPAEAKDTCLLVNKRSQRPGSAELSGAWLPNELRTSTREDFRGGMHRHRGWSLGCVISTWTDHDDLEGPAHPKKLSSSHLDE
jgi:hypothetical protein